MQYFEIEGKKGRKVPVLVPDDVVPIFEVVATDPLKLKSKYLFANSQDPSKVYSSAAALNWAVEEAG